MNKNDWFEVSREGLRRQAKERGAAPVLLELVSNVMDEAKSGATRCDIALTRPPSQRYVQVEVSDDSPSGWRNLGDAWTLFAESYKRSSTQMRGQFNIGEKWFLALCREARIISTGGGVAFDANGRRRLRRKLERGTNILADFEMSVDEQDEFERLLSMVVSPELDIFYNGDLLPSRELVAGISGALRTKVADSDGVMRETRRTADVHAFEPIDDEQPMLFEMGIPVVKIDCRWHLNVCQRVPLNHGRDNVTPAYRVEILTLAAEMAVKHGLLNKDDAAGWCTEVLERTDNKEVVEAIVTQRFGEKRVIADPSDSQATAKAATQGYTVIHGGSLTGLAWERVKEHANVKPAGQFQSFATAQPFSSDPLAEMVEFLPSDELSKPMKAVSARAKRFASKALGGDEPFDLDVRFTRQRLPKVAAFWEKTGPSNAILTFNTPALGRPWFAAENAIQQNSLLVHEIAHQIVGSHHECERGQYFHEACTLIAGRLLAPPA